MVGDEAVVSSQGEVNLSILTGGGKLRVVEAVEEDHFIAIGGVDPNELAGVAVILAIRLAACIKVVAMKGDASEAPESFV
jgi:hypothetical protein